ncbi:alpha/beta-hydrolase [Apiospora saccharicola]
MSPTSPPKPTILLLQGSFQVPEVYHKLSVALETAGFPVIQRDQGSKGLLRRSMSIPLNTLVWTRKMD